MRIDASMVRIMVDVLTMDGLDGVRLLKEAGCERIETLSEQPWAPMALWDRLLIAASDAAPDPAYGLTHGASMAWAQLFPFAMLAMHAPSLRQMVRDFDRFQPLLSDRPETTLVESGIVAKIVIQPMAQAPRARMFRAEAAAMGVVLLLRLSGARVGDIGRIGFDHPAPAHASRYEDILAAPVLFGQSELAVHFASRLLDLPLRGRDPALYAQVQGRAEAALAARRGPHGDIGRVLREMLIQRLPATPGLAEAAAYLTLSERSLRRELHRLDVRYSELLQECQRARAEQLIARGDLSFAQVAEAVGFRSTDAFFRAFRRWTNMTPTGWREHHRSAAAP